MEEANLEAWLKRSRLGIKSVMGGYQKGSHMTKTKTNNRGTAVVQSAIFPGMEVGRSLPIRGLTREQIDEKRRKKLYFSCDEPYTVRQQCRKPQLFMMLPSNENNNKDCDNKECCENDELEGGKAVEQQEAHITLHALSGHSVNNTIRIMGMANGKLLRILIDSGSTNNFLDPHAARRVKAMLQETKHVSIFVADGFKVTSFQECRSFN